MQLVVKNPPANAGDVRDVGLIIRMIPWRRRWQPTAVFLPEESHGQRRLVATFNRVAKSQTQMK